MNLYVPRPGEEIKLTKDWSFTLYNEDRNRTLIEYTGDKYEWTWTTNCTPLKTVTIPAGSTLKIDRVYIRKNLAEFDSITFLWMDAHTAARTEPGYGGRVVKIPKRIVRFWAKLEDTRNIVFEPV